MNCAYEFTRSPVGYIFLLLFSLYFDALCISIHLLDTAKSNSGSALSVNLSSNNREKYCKCRKERYKLGIEVTILMIQKGIKEHARSDGYQVMVELRRVMCLIKDGTSCVAVRDLFQTLCGCFALHLLIEKLCVLLSSETRMPEISRASRLTPKPKGAYCKRTRRRRGATR